MPALGKNPVMTNEQPEPEPATIATMMKRLSTAKPNTYIKGSSVPSHGAGSDGSAEVSTTTSTVPKKA